MQLQHFWTTELLNLNSLHSGLLTQASYGQYQANQKE
jgi:hypothetical protein